MPTPIFDQLASEFAQQGYPQLPLHPFESSVITETRPKEDRPRSPLSRPCPKCKSLMGIRCHSVKTGKKMTTRFHPERLS